MRLRNSILAVLMLVIISSGCIDSPENTGGDEVISSWQVSEISFSEKPVKGQQTTLRFQIESKQNINDSRIKIHLPENASIKGRDIWRQRMAKGETYTFKRKITFREYGLYRVSITAGMYNKNGTILQGDENKYINITESRTEIMDTLPQENDSGNTQETVKNQSEQP